MIGDKTKLAILVAVIVGLALAAFLVPRNTLLHMPGGPLPVILVGGVLVSALIPRTAITIACGALFGPMLGAGYAYAAAILAALATFWVGRWLGRDFVRTRAKGKIAALDRWLCRRGAWAVAIVRLSPVHYGLAGYLYGGTAVRTRAYVIGTLLGAAPAAMTHAALGAAIAEPGGMTVVTIIPAIVGLVVMIVAAFWWRRSPAPAPAATPVPESGTT